jgi:hypothetical protein
MKLNEFVLKLSKTASGSVVKANVSRLLYRKDTELINLLKEHSPYDPKHKDPHFRDQWKASRKKYGNSKVLAQIIVSNNTPNYGQFLVAGAEPNQAPWYYPGRVRKGKKKGQFKKGTGKLKTAQGKVWAGGLDPGHSKTVGGPIIQVLTKFSDKLTQEVSDEFVKGFI